MLKIKAAGRKRRAERREKQTKVGQKKGSRVQSGGER